MSIRIAINHKTTYRYDRPVTLSPHIIRLRPAPHCRTPILAYSLKVNPEKQFFNWQQDPYNNYLARLVFPEQSDFVSVEVDLIAQMVVINPFDFFIDDDAQKFPFKYDAVLSKELIPYFEIQPACPLLDALTKKLTKKDVRSIDVLVDVNRAVQDRIKYLIRLEPGIQAPDETLALGSGSCRDSAWLLVQMLRRMGLAARFVSGYLVQLTPDVKSLDGPSGTATDFTDLHAWTEVYIPGAGWIGLDPTSGLLAGEGHIPLACSADPITAAPVTGSFFFVGEKKVETKFEFEMSIRRVHETPRVTKPYTEEQWTEIESLGHEVDRQLKAGDVRLTMGGEPTFVSIDDMDGPQWNTTALGPDKRERARELVDRLKAQHAPQGLLHLGQGKQYPGEPLPRWAFSVYWRRDGQPIWFDPSLIADDRKPGVFNETHARDFAVSLASRLQVDPAFVSPGYEDAWYHLWVERRLPANVDPFDSKLSNEQDRARLAKIFEQGLTKVVGYALPLARAGNRWISSPWFMRAERMYLLPGDSPMGFRLPLSSLPWVHKSDYPYLTPQDPTLERGPLAKATVTRQHYTDAVDRAGFRNLAVSNHAAGNTGEGAAINGRPTTPMAVARGQSDPSVVRTALCVETRQGHVHIFMPPVYSLDDFLDLTTAIEATAAALKMPVLIEGYQPPQDYRVNHFRVTPDPGVIEVNIHPAHSWDELVSNTTTLYEHARQSRLTTEKFMVDGRHTGTGGGNHIVIGGPTPADSPFLRRPDLLKSLLAYWLNHPSLSYVFSGLFLGPTSQAPRIDEARHDTLNELEIAFKQVPCPREQNRYLQPWLIDRIFRHLLTDMTGNTHRAEFCIDKLYSPDSSTGRLGLVEMRAFEMPPHARMSLTQQLLLRALIARFWRRPYDAPLVRWGTQLHDRFMLPYFVEHDLHDVIADLNRDGYAFQPEWFAAHMEFRFPLLGEVTHHAINLQIRQAIEPWHVLGEESGGGGTVRYVDSSVERIELRVLGLTDTRHIVTCNGRAVPLHPTGVNGQFVAGVRYRAWQPASCLHPTIGVHSPLVFDVHDSWSRRSIGGCQYHVAHPGGRSFDTFPVNAYEAESRRIARFFKSGHTPSTQSVARAVINPQFPLTLDLRHG